MAKFIVIGLQSFNFKDDNGRTVKGNLIYFIDKSSSESYRGLKTGKIRIPDDLVKEFNVLPGLYELDFSVRIGSGGRTISTVNSVEFISEVNIEARHKKA